VTVVELDGVSGTVLVDVLLELLLVLVVELPPPQATNCNKVMTMSTTRKPCFILSFPSCDQKEGGEILNMTLIEFMVDDNALFMHQNKFLDRSIAYPNKWFALFHPYNADLLKEFRFCSSSNLLTNSD